LRKDVLAGEGQHRDRDLVRAAADDLDGELGAGGAREREERCCEQGELACRHSLGLNLRLSSRKNCSGLSGLGSGDAFRIARSTLSSYSWLPLDLTSFTSITSPEGICTMWKIASGFPLISDGTTTCLLIAVRILSIYPASGSPATGGALAALASGFGGACSAFSSCAS